MVTRRPSSKIYSGKAPILENFVPRKFPPIYMVSTVYTHSYDK